ncbi:holo-ACP synthase [uncultured Agrococcus sp.]|uniref:holo-ACP synthase n=1 Tax=uncultured Agrococcus sp. TaxID=382258 RepID=UPI0025CD41ED|nr:holo-ACP synthase [uncultured Agrococcus sp.]
MIVSVGLDIADIARFERAMSRTPRLAARLFTEPELTRDGAPRRLRSLAGQFAAKEAVFKALGGLTNRWHDVVVERNGAGRPSIELRGEALRIAHEAGAERWHVSITHDGGVAAAVVVLESA